jgi:hypothetical protein
MITVAQITGNTTDAGSGTANFAAVTAGNLLVIFVAKDASAAFAVGDISKSAGTATLGAFTLDSHAERINGAENIACAVYSAPITSSGSVTILFSATHYYWVGLAEVAGCDVSVARVDGQNTGNGITGLPVTGSVTSTAGAIFCGALATYSSGALTHTPGTGYSQVYEEENGALHMTGSSETQIVATSTSDTADWNAPNMSAAWAACVAVYKDSRVAPPVPRADRIAATVFPG